MSGGSVVIRDGANQQQDVNALSRDTDNANGSIGPIFDKEKEQNRLKQAQLIGEIAGQTMDIVRTQGDINGLQKAKDKHPGLDATALRKTPEYQAEMQKYGTGSDMQRAAQAVTGALQALAGNNLAGALASGAAPYLAREIKARVGENNVAANAMAHALLGAITAQLNNQSAVAGAVGAGGGELAARVIAEIRFPGRDISSLTEGEKQEVSALSQLAAGLAGGIASDSTAGAVAASQAGKNAVENNFLGGNEETQTKFVQQHGKNIASCSTDPSSASCQKGLAMNDALMVALPAGLGGGLLAAATPEIAAAAKAAIQACAGNVVLCLNNAGIQMSEAIVPGGVGAGGAVGIGKTAAEATAAKAEAVAANAAKSLSSDIGKINAGKFGQIELNSLSKTGTNIDPAAKSGNFTVAGRALQKHGSREGSVYPVAKGTPTQINEQGQKILDGIVKAPGASVKEGNRFGGFDVIAPDGRGARFDPQGNFRGFLEP
ncbi:Possible hemagglutinin (DUF638) [Serratia liquefaciens]|nr:Possible hemagglutinin (DUF638) [Serratia liquefaciens]